MNDCTYSYEKRSRWAVKRLRQGQNRRARQLLNEAYQEFLKIFIQEKRHSELRSISSRAEESERISRLSPHRFAPSSLLAPASFALSPPSPTDFISSLLTQRTLLNSPPPSCPSLPSPSYSLLHSSEEIRPSLRDPLLVSRY